MLSWPLASTLFTRVPSHGLILIILYLSRYYIMYLICINRGSTGTEEQKIGGEFLKGLAVSIKDVFPMLYLEFLEISEGL